MTSIKPTGTSLGSEEAEYIYRQLHRALARKYRGKLPFDMSNVNFVRPSGILSLVIAAKSWHEWTGGSTVLTHVQPQVHAYLDRIDLFSTCNKFIEVDNELAPA